MFHAPSLFCQSTIPVLHSEKAAMPRGWAARIRREKTG
jgi:hypothetical protein